MNYAKALCATLLIAASGSAVAEDQWQYQLSPYVWFSGSKGETTSIPGLPATPFKLTPSDAIDDNEASYMVVFQGKKNGRGFFIDGQYTDTRSDYDVIPALGLVVESTTKNTIVSAAYVHELVNNGETFIDGFAGVRYWDVESILKFKGGLGLLAGTKLDNSEDWYDPMIGIKGRSQFGDTNFFSVGWLGFGGFGVGSDRFFDVSINLGYQWSQSIDTTLGYRSFDVDYEDGDYLYDVKNAGWMIGLTWRI